jgi:hypothetical protein
MRLIVMRLSRAIVPVVLLAAGCGGTSAAKVSPEPSASSVESNDRSHDERVPSFPPPIPLLDAPTCDPGYECGGTGDKVAPH